MGRGWVWVWDALDHASCAPQFTIICVSGNYTPMTLTIFAGALISDLNFLTSVKYRHLFQNTQRSWPRQLQRT